MKIYSLKLTKRWLKSQICCKLLNLKRLVMLSAKLNAIKTLMKWSAKSKIHSIILPGTARIIMTFTRPIMIRIIATSIEFPLMWWMCRELSGKSNTSRQNNKNHGPGLLMNEILTTMFSKNLRNNLDFQRMPRSPDLNLRILTLKLQSMKLLQSMQNRKTATMVSRRVMDSCDKPHLQRKAI